MVQNGCAALPPRPRPAAPHRRPVAPPKAHATRLPLPVARARQHRLGAPRIILPPHPPTSHSVRRPPVTLRTASRKAAARRTPTRADAGRRASRRASTTVSVSAIRASSFRRTPSARRAPSPAAHPRSPHRLARLVTTAPTLSSPPALLVADHVRLSMRLGALAPRAARRPPRAPPHA